MESTRRKTARQGRRALAMVAGFAAVGLASACASAPAATLEGGPEHGSATPIKHLVVIFQENVSFDHYFGTYPNAANTDGTKFTAQRGTPQVDGLNDQLLQHNPNKYNPKRLSPAQAITCDQDHEYKDEQLAVNGGKMDKFVEHTQGLCNKPGQFSEPGLVMDYYDGNTVTGLWNYAQHFAMSDNSFGTGFGPSTPGAINLVAANTHGGQAVDPVTHKPVSDPSVVVSPDANGVGTVIEDPDPAFDDCSNNNHTGKSNLLAMQGRNIGDLLNDRNVSWGWFQGGFRPTGTANGYEVCGTTHKNIGGGARADYNPHHEPFQYYKSTANEKHLPPSSPEQIGKTDQANHQYDLADFDTAVKDDNLPAVSYLKAANYQDGHAGYSDPIDEQHFVVDTINKLQQSPEWKNTAVVVAYDDSDGWYDHVMGPIVNGSNDPANDDPALCGKKPAMAGQLDRCGYGPRLPLLVVSPYAKQNFVDHTLTDQASILRFVEDNWHTGRIGGGSLDEKSGKLDGLFNFCKPHNTPVLLDPQTGAITGEVKGQDDQGQDADQQGNCNG